MLRLLQKQLLTQIGMGENGNMAQTLVNSRSTLKEYCLRRLGKPAIDINVEDDQIDDRIDDAFQYYRDYHYDATERLYKKYQITQTDVDNGYIDFNQTDSEGLLLYPEWKDAIIGIINIFPTSQEGWDTVNMFDMRYQMRLNDLYDFTDVSILHYTMVMQHVSLLDDYFSGRAPFNFSRHKNELHVYCDWATDMTVGNYIIIECDQIINPDTYNEVYNDIWLKKYVTALIKQQWGQNLSKYDGITLPGGLTYNGQAILDSANEEISTLHEEMDSKHGALLGMIIG